MKDEVNSDEMIKYNTVHTKHKYAMFTFHTNHIVQNK